MFQVNRKWTYTPTNGRLEALGSDSSSSNSFLVWSIVRNLQTNTLQETALITTPPSQQMTLTLAGSLRIAMVCGQHWSDSSSKQWE